MKVSSKKFSLNSSKHLIKYSRLVRPTECWLLNTIYVAFLIFLFQMFVVPIEFEVQNIEGEKTSNTTERSIMGIIFSMLLFSPIVETYFVTVIYKAFFFRFGLLIFIAVSTLFSNLLHFWLGRPVSPLIVSFGFVLMSIQYHLFYVENGKKIAFWGVFLTHSFYNLQLLLLSVMLTMFMA